MIPIFDSLSHPTLTGKWLGKGLDASFGSLVKEMQDSGFIGACAIGIAGVENYSHKSFIAECEKYDCLVPVAGINPKGKGQIAQEIKHVRHLGYKAVKVHPRFSGLTLNLSDIEELFHAASNEKMIVFYCTYFHGPLCNYPSNDPFYSLVQILKRCPKLKVVLVHGGDVNLMRYAELVRFNENLLLDLSLTFMKYQGSSVDLDIKFLFNQFDRRICIGTDHPEYSHKEVRERFNNLSKDVSRDKLYNIAYLNLNKFLEI